MSDDAGRLLTISTEKTVNDKNIVTDKPIFSPASGGNQKTVTVKRDRTTIGIAMLTIK